MKLICDIDSTLNNHQARLRKFNGGRQAYTHKEVMKDKPQPNSVSVMQEFAGKFDISYLTARGWDIDGQNGGRTSRCWLATFGYPEPDNVIVVNKMADKIEVLKKEEPDIYIDDFTTGIWPNITLHTDIIAKIKRLGIHVIRARYDWLKIKEQVCKILTTYK